MLGWLGFEAKAIFGIAIDYVIAGGLIAGGIYLLVSFWLLRLARVAGGMLVVAGTFVGAFSFGKSTTLADCISQARLAAVQSALDAANSELKQWKDTAELRSEQLKELAKARSERDAQLAKAQARVGKLPDAVRRGRAATRDDDRELCRIVSGQAPGC